MHHPPRALTPTSNSSEEDKQNPLGTPRKIRFAPFPDPRRAIAVDEDGKEVEMVEDEGTISFGITKDASPPVSIEEQLASSRPESIASTEEAEEYTATRKERPRSWGTATKSFLSPFLAKSSSKGGFLSPDTDDGEDYMSTKLTRRTSTGGLSGSNPDRFQWEVKRAEEFLGGSALKQMISANSDVENPSRSHTRAHSADKRRMLLNGRVYGGGRQKQEKYTEPEFVEWGYGGMGSQKAAAQTRWQSVQGKTVYNSGGNSRGVDEDSDDGSGMAWVRKRRRERELKAQMEKEKEQAKNGQENENVPQAQSVPPISTNAKTQPSAHSSTRTTPTASTLSSALSSRSQSPQPSIGSAAANSGIATGASTPHVDDEHHYRAVSLPPPTTHHHHHHLYKHHGDKDHRPLPPPLAPVTAIDAINQQDMLGTEAGIGKANTLQLELTPATPVSPEHEENKLSLQQANSMHVPNPHVVESSESSDSESSDEDDDDDDDDDDEPGIAREKKRVASSETDSTESDVEDAPDNKPRLTSASAGVEKVSTKGRRG
ncbi:hypothetical protein DACRYDRAFT_20182 [Dacryopinax primogenitus]|uniref:Uncharacterized protein n=1 Tax=Dacryopinax primogenitus (strain DJM 731) TaxID=1858805 RepID=M5GAF0_DACPD|nr:uncharacterized protein DACRYDRAFT_20182 [Dacryopinax primogenitus]EJU05809.1 hypothetical protein DACRYDRAFT_20182 [Dacryopinax primogenitus]